MTIIVEINNVEGKQYKENEESSNSSVKMFIKLINLFSLTTKVEGEKISLSEMKKRTPLRQ